METDHVVEARRDVTDERASPCLADRQHRAAVGRETSGVVSEHDQQLSIAGRHPGDRVAGGLDAVDVGHDEQAGTAADVGGQVGDEGRVALT